MELNFIRLLSKSILLIWFCWLGTFSAFSQNTLSHNVPVDKEKFRVKWVSQVPLQKTQKNSWTFSKKLLNFILGKKAPALSKPISVLAEHPGYFWVLDQGSRAVLHIRDNAIEIPRSFEKELVNFQSLVGLCALPTKEILFTDSRLNKIYRLSADGKNLEVFNDTLLLRQPTGIAYSKVNGNIWVVETKAHRISVLDGKGRLVKRVGRRGTNPGEFNYPTSIWIDRLGNVYIVDSLNFRVQVFDKNGNLISVFGEHGDASGNFARPKGIATDSYGNIYIPDALFHVVQIFDKSGNFLYAFGSQGQDKEQFWMPSGISIDEKDFIYVADSYNSRVQIFQLTNINEYEEDKNR